MYESPITIVYGDIQTEFKKETESLVFRCVQNVGVDVDKDELIKALGYDRDQYDKGYADAKAEIVHCKDCRLRNEIDKKIDIWRPCMAIATPDNFSCIRAESANREVAE